MVGFRVSACVFLTVWAALPVFAGNEVPEVASEVVERVDDLQSLVVEASAINDFIYKIEGQGAVFLINTDEGAVLVDTGFDNEQAALQKKIIDDLRTGPIRKIIVTHAHQDHSGGLPRWREEIEGGVEFVGHQRYGYMSRHYLEPLRFLKQRFKLLYPDVVVTDPTHDRS